MSHIPTPRCACGCGRRVRSAKNLWATLACVPRSVRAAGARKGRRNFAYRKRRELFSRELADLQGRTLTREALLDAFKRIYTRGYNSGYQAGLHKATPAIVEIAEPTKASAA